MLCQEKTEKQKIDKSIINRYVCFLYDVWGKDIPKIYSKLMVVIQDRFIYYKEDLKYINLEINKILN